MSDSGIDYGPHKLCIPHKRKIIETQKCIYCELIDLQEIIHDQDRKILELNIELNKGKLD